MRLQERADFLDAKIKSMPDRNLAYDAQERSALWWALEQIELMDVISAAIADTSLSDSEKVFAIEGVMEARRRPSAVDLERHPGLRRVVEEQLGRRAIARDIRDAAHAVTPSASEAP